MTFKNAACILRSASSLARTSFQFAPVVVTASPIDNAFFDMLQLNTGQLSTCHSIDPFSCRLSTSPSGCSFDWLCAFGMSTYTTRQQQPLNRIDYHWALIVQSLRTHLLQLASNASERTSDRDAVAAQSTRTHRSSRSRDTTRAPLAWLAANARPPACSIDRYLLHD